MQPRINQLGRRAKLLIAAALVVASSFGGVSADVSTAVENSAGTEIMQPQCNQTWSSKRADFDAPADVHSRAETGCLDPESETADAHRR